MPSNRTQNQNAPSYPWAELFDLESRIVKPAPAKQARPGRPHRAFIRRRTTIMLSDEELSMLDITELRIKESMRPALVTKGQVIGLAVRLLNDRALKLLPERSSSWEDIVKALFLGERPELEQ
jgi:hypothetical protein